MPAALRRRFTALALAGALGAGATRFITKPFAPDALLGEVRALLESAPGATA